MPKAFVLMHIRPGSEEEVGKQLRQSKNVSDADFLYGVYDYIVTVTAPTKGKLKTSVLALRKIPEITSTMIMMVVE